MSNSACQVPPGYTTRRSVTEPRCSTCAHVRPSGRLLGASQYDRRCARFDAAVKTHGGCAQHAPAASPAESDRR